MDRERETEKVRKKRMTEREGKRVREKERNMERKEGK